MIPNSEWSVYLSLSNALIYVSSTGQGVALFKLPDAAGFGNKHDYTTVQESAADTFSLSST